MPGYDSFEAALDKATLSMTNGSSTHVWLDIAAADLGANFDLGTMLQAGIVPVAWRVFENGTGAQITVAVTNVTLYEQPSVSGSFDLLTVSPLAPSGNGSRSWDDIFSVNVTASEAGVPLVDVHVLFDAESWTGPPAPAIARQAQAAHVPLPVKKPEVE